MIKKASALLFCLVLYFSAAVYAFPTHLDKSKVRKGCSDCHKGHGRKSTSMLIASGDDLCMKCHGSYFKGHSESFKNDIYSVLNKESSHMFVQEFDSVAIDNKIPGIFIEPKKRISCKDCHNSHKSERGKSINGVKGFQRNRPLDNRDVREFEICYKCHSGNQGFSVVSSFDVSLDFSPANPSYHPVETFARRSVVPSLKAGYSLSSTITCSDCHGNDDPSGPAGPHGSVYSPILKYQYVRDQASESPQTYALCYNCHERSSILNDDSFKAHRIHIVYNHLSCAVCHSAHGSRLYRSLIRFDNSMITANSTGNMGLMPLMQGKPRCYLSCHINGTVYEHKIDGRLQYAINDRSLPQW